MKFTAAALLAVATLSSALPSRPSKRAAAISDTDILQYALTLENLENNFYSTALKKYDAAAFEKAGFPSWVRGRIAEIGSHEAQHVALLSGAIGASATKPCNYSFPYTDPKSFVALASVLEGVGTSAYLGAAQYVTDPTYLTVAAAILTTEARHQGWVSSAALKSQPWSGPEDTPLSFSQIYTLAAPFIKSCPSSNPALPVTAFPTLTGSPANAPGGTEVTYKFTPANSTSGGNTTYYAVYYSGLSVTAVELSSSKKAKVPKGLVGTYYTVISTAQANVTDSNSIAGPLISTVNFPSTA